ncbi:hypothetical protein D3C83_118620 [compost metagenome]
MHRHQGADAEEDEFVTGAGNLRKAKRRRDERQKRQHAQRRQDAVNVGIARAERNASRRMQQIESVEIIAAGLDQ